LRLLLDTHIWLWSLLEPEKLSPEVAFELESPGNELWLSPITLWEVFLLAEKGRVVLHGPTDLWIAKALEVAPFREAPLTHEVAIQSRKIDLPHQDPADRFLVATALVYELTFVTSDEKILGAKPVPLLAS